GSLAILNYIHVLEKKHEKPIQSGYIKVILAILFVISVFALANVYTKSPPYTSFNINKRCIKLQKELKMNKKYLLLYGLLTVGIAVALWGLNLWAAENIMYGLLIVPIQLGLMQLVFKHRESADSFVNHLVIVPSTLFMFLIINTISASLFISFLIALIMLI